MPVEKIAYIFFYFFQLFFSYIWKRNTIVKDLKTEIVILSIF